MSGLLYCRRRILLGLISEKVKAEIEEYKNKFEAVKERINEFEKRFYEQRENQRSLKSS